jgi:hypothetical protein
MYLRALHAQQFCKWYSKLIKKSNFAKNLLDNGHSVDPIEDIMDILHATKKRCTYEHTGGVSYKHTNQKK